MTSCELRMTKLRWPRENAENTNNFDLPLTPALRDQVRGPKCEVAILFFRGSGVGFALPRLAGRPSFETR